MPQPVQVGTTLGEFTTPTLDRLAFARLSVSLDDPNLVHLDENVARTAGFDDVIGSGGLMIGIAYEVVRRWAGMERILSGTVKQLAPYTTGSAFTGTGSVVEIESDGDKQVAVCDVEIRDQDSRVFVQAKFRVRTN